MNMGLCKIFLLNVTLCKRNSCTLHLVGNWPCYFREARQTRAGDQTPPAPAYSRTQRSKTNATSLERFFAHFSCSQLLYLNNNLTPHLSTAAFIETSRQKHPDGEKEMEQVFSFHTNQRKEKKYEFYILVAGFLCVVWSMIS